MNNFFKGIRFQITLVYSTLFGLFICVFAYIISNQYFESARKDFDSGLLNYAIDLSQYLSTDDSGLKINFNLPASEGVKDFPFILNNTYYSVRSLEGTVLTKSDKPFPFLEIPYDPKLPLKTDYTRRFLSFSEGKNIYRAVNLKISNYVGQEMILQVATPYNSVVKRETDSLLVTFLTVPFLIVVSSFLAYLIAGKTLSPIKRLTDAATKIAAQNLSLRVPEANTRDEVEELAKTLNNLLGRLEKSFKAQEHFVANASHQLNTPLSIIKGELDVLESKSRSLDEHQRFQKSLREEVERLIELVKNLLLVSRVESGSENFIFYPLRLDDLLLNVTSRLSFKAKEKRILVRFNIDEEITNLEVMGEKQLLDSLFENIIDNAIKYSPESSTIDLQIRSAPKAIEVWIQDEGPGISDQDLKEISSKRFRRGSAINMPGTGIGMSIAYQIAEYHNATIDYHRLNKGSLFKVIFSLS